LNNSVKTESILIIFREQYPEEITRERDGQVGQTIHIALSIFLNCWQTKCPVAELQPCPGYDQIATSSGTENRKVGKVGLHAFVEWTPSWIFVVMETIWQPMLCHKPILGVSAPSEGLGLHSPLSW